VVTGVTARRLLVRLGEAMFAFSPGRDITVGRGADTDIRVDIAAKQAISRVHMVVHADPVGRDR
jgi:ABC transport system ATP-binding/permease protein